MKQLTEQIITPALAADGTLTEAQRERALVILRGGTPPPVRLLLTQKEFAAHLGVSRVTVHNWTKSGTVKPVDLPGGMKRYRRGDLLRLAGIDGEGRAAS